METYATEVRRIAELVRHGKTTQEAVNIAVQEKVTRELVAEVLGRKEVK